MLNQEQIDAFNENGYLVVPDMLNREQISDIKQEYSELLTDLCKEWSLAGQLDPGVATLDFNQQLLAIIDAGLDYFQPLDISLPLGGVQPDTPIHTGKAVFNMMTSPKLLDSVESLIGPELTSNPIQHVRIKPPFKDVAEGEGRAHIVKTDWHQDRAVALEESDNTQMVTVWLAITDATVDNGCLQVIPKSHKEAILPHCPQTHQVGIPASEIDLARAQPLPVEAGGAILFHPLTVHSSLENYSETVRWSFDIRYNTTGQPTGRPVFPEFVARSRLRPDTELRDADRWTKSWTETRAALSRDNPDLTFNRWDGSQNICA